MYRTIKAWTQRPSVWADIAEFCLSVNNSITATVQQYPNELGRNNDKHYYLCISRWVRDYKAGAIKKSVGGKPVYRNEVDKQLYGTIIKRNDLGLPMDPFIMRTLLMIHLRDAGKQQLAKEHGGSNVFGPSWAQRFLKRHNLKRRVATTKMRELPADFLQKLEHYRSWNKPFKAKVTAFFRDSVWDMGFRR